jgi:hypothetical protein
MLGKGAERPSGSFDADQAGWRAYQPTTAGLGKAHLRAPEVRKEVSAERRGAHSIDRLVDWPGWRWRRAPQIDRR